MMRRERFAAIRSAFRSENFQNFSRPQNFAFGIARDRAEIEGEQLAHDPQRSTRPVLSVGVLRRVKFHAICNGFPTEIFENFSRPQNFAFGIARDRAEIRVARRR